MKSSCMVHMTCHIAVIVAAHACVVLLYTAKVVAVCAAPCIRFGRFNAFLFLFQIEESKGTSAATVTRGTMELTSESAIFYGWK